MAPFERYPMEPERWRLLEEIYHAALMRPAAERGAFLAAACADDEMLRREVESLLDSSATPEGFLAAPALAVVAAEMVSDAAASVPTGQRFGVQRLLDATDASFVRSDQARR